MKAQEALKISEDNSPKIENIYSEIDRQAKNGARFAMEWRNLPFEIVQTLIKDGYKISKFINPQDGAEITKIEW